MADCASDSPRPGPSPLTRLDNTELNNSIRALLPPGTSEAGLPWLPEERAQNDVMDSPPSSDTVERLHALAHSVALRMTDGRGEGWLAGCDVEAEGEAACRDSLGAEFLERAYRRPLTTEDQEELANAFEMGRKVGGSFASGMRAIVELALQSPDFVYLLELGDGSAVGDAVELTSFETAARLSYFLTGGPPDAELNAAATLGPLSDEQLAAHARRLAESPNGRMALSLFYTRQLGADHLAEVPELGFDADLARDALEGSRRFVDDVLFNGPGTLSALLTEPSAWTNGALAAYYGYSAVGDDWQKVLLPSRSSGFFTQPAFLASTSRSSYVSAVQRGVRVLRQVLCYDVPPPPVEGMTSLPEASTAPTTDRGRLEAETRSTACQQCHVYIDPVGLAFGNYDAVGKWRDDEQGTTVDASGVLDRTEAAGTFSNAAGLMQNIADSVDAKSCFVRLWLGRAQRRPVVASDACVEQKLTRSFLEGGGEILPLLEDIAQSDALRYRSRSELPPSRP